MNKVEEKTPLNKEETQSLTARMQAIKSKYSASEKSTIPERMLESIRQSLKVEGYDIPISNIRKVAEHFEADVETQ